MNRDLSLKLVVPLAVLSGAALVVHHWWDYGSVLVSLATGLVVVVVTVSYVDWVVRRHETERWSGTDARIAQRLEVFVNALISSIRVGLRFSPDVLDAYGPPTTDLRQIHRNVLRVSEEVLSPTAHARVVGLDEAGWKILMTNLQNVWGEAERILDRFYDRLKPRQIELLLDIQYSIEQALVYWRTFPDVMGVSPERLPKMGTPPERLVVLNKKVLEYVRPIPVNFVVLVASTISLVVIGVPLSLLHLWPLGLRLSWTAVGYMAISAPVIWLIAFNAYYFALRSGRVGVVGPLCSTDPLFTALFAAVLVGTAIGKLTLAGLLVTVAGVVFISRWMDDQRESHAPMRPLD